MRQFYSIFTHDYTLLSSKANESNCFSKYYTTVFQDNKISLYMEYHKESLVFILENKQNEIIKQRFSHNIILCLISNLINSFAFMSASNIKHINIQPSSFLITENSRIILNSQAFLSYRTIEEISLAKESQLIINQNIDFLAPELKNKSSKYKFIDFEEKSQVFSVGMIIYCLLTLSILNNYSIKDRKTLKMMRRAKLIADDQNLMELLRRMLQADPERRPSFSDCLAFLRIDPTLPNHK